MESKVKLSKYEHDLAIVDTILSKSELTFADRMQLLSVYSVSYHSSGKIEGCTSCDSSCHNCAFCQQMIKASEKNPLIICGLCYDDAQEKRWTNVEKRHGLNMRILSSVLFEVGELALLPITGLCRFNSSGDTPNEIYALNCIRIAKAHPFAHCALWAKNVLPCESAFDAEGKPANMIFIQSSPQIGFPAVRSRYADYTFTVYPDEYTVTEAIREGACECNGKKCRECGYKCYLGTWEKGADIAELLRCTDKQRARILSAYWDKIGKLYSPANDEYISVSELRDEYAQGVASGDIEEKTFSEWVESCLSCFPFGGLSRRG